LGLGLGLPHSNQLECCGLPFPCLFCAAEVLRDQLEVPLEIFAKLAQTSSVDVLAG